jgi:hypothetical protein
MFPHITPPTGLSPFHTAPQSTTLMVAMLDALRKNTVRETSVKVVHEK